MRTRRSTPSLRSSAAVLAAALILGGALAPPAGAEESGTPGAAPAPAGRPPVPSTVAEKAGELQAPATVQPPAGRTVSVSAVVETADGPQVVRVEVPPRDVARAEARLRSRSGVTAVAADSPVSVLGWSEPYFPDQWGYSELNLWEGLPPDVPDGSGVQVAVLDTGVSAGHEDLVGRVRCDLGADFTSSVSVSTGDGCTDPHGHGTHVAGTIGAISDNGLGVAGVSAAEIIPVRVLGTDGWGEDAGVVAGIYWAVDHGAEIVNMSLGGDEDTPLLDAAVQYAVDRGVVVVASAGNNREDGNAVHYPAATPGVFAVASTDDRGVSSWFSYSGPTNLIAAPGSDIISTTIGDDPYGYMSGTSMATPHVAGVLARYRAAHPEATVAQIRAAVQATAEDMEAPGWDANTGFGMIDAVELLTGEDSPPRRWLTAPGEPTQLTATPRDGSIDLTWQAPLFTGGIPIEGYAVTVHEGTRVTETSYLGNHYVGPAARHFTVPHLRNGQPYLVFLSAYHYHGEMWGNSAFTRRPVTPVAVVRTAPAAPGSASAAPAAASATVRWAAPASDGGAPLTRYVVRTYRGTALVQTLTVAGSETSAHVTGLVNGTAYTFSVAAGNAVGEGQESGRTATVIPRTTPGAPRVGKVTAGKGTARVTWTAPAATGGAPVTGYVLKVWKGARLAKSVTVAGSARAATVKGLRGGVAYRVTVTARNDAGLGAQSAKSRSVTPRR